LSHASSHFCSGYFGDKVLLLPRLAWTTVVLFYTSHHHWYDRCVPPCQAFFHWDEVSYFFAWAVLELWSPWFWPPSGLGLSGSHLQAQLLVEMRPCKLLPGLALNRNPPHLKRVIPEKINWRDKPCLHVGGTIP
jgi:hypothetical protein